MEREASDYNRLDHKFDDDDDDDDGKLNFGISYCRIRKDAVSYLA